MKIIISGPAQKFFMARKKHKRLEFTERLVDAGWRTPDCYSRDYETIPDSPGIYLLLASADVTADEAPVVAYVGKSMCLSRRLNGHPVANEIYRQAPDSYVQRWFLKLPADEIASAEVNSIRLYDPPLNLQHRLRSLAI